ncbi:TPA: thioredoxin peroxidase [Candidatus Uhrbacteria bacterium]|nr:thioredoxin peroxidase [Candidatus Uhrbacteria bacterium]
MINVGQEAPKFYLQTAYQAGEFKQLSLTDFLGKWLVLLFYPRDFTFICPTELKSFAKHTGEFEALNASIVGISTDSEWSHKAWFERDLPEVTFPIVADTSHSTSRDYDVLDFDGSSQRGLFIINPEGVVMYALVSAGSVGRSTKETLRVLQALQSGDLCPVEWEPGVATLGKA